MHIDILPRPGDAVRRKSSENWKTTLWFPLHDNAPTHWSDLVKGQCDNNGEPGSNWFLHVPGFKSSLNGRRFCDATDIIKNATGEMKRLSQSDFQKYSRQLYSGWQNYIVAQEHYFLWKCSLHYCPFLYFSEIKWFREHFEATTYYWHSNTSSRGKYMAANFIIVYNRLAGTGIHLPKTVAISVNINFSPWGWSCRPETYRRVE